MKKKILTLLLSSVLIITMIMPTFADNAYTTTGSKNIPVHATVNSSYYVSVPSTAGVTLNLKEGTVCTYENTCYVGVKGNISPAKKVTCCFGADTNSPTNDFIMTNSDDGTTTATATATQAKKEWVVGTPGDNQLSIGSSDYTNADCVISVDLPVAGSYTGNLTVNFSLDDV